MHQKHPAPRVDKLSCSINISYRPHSPCPFFYYCHTFLLLLPSGLLLTQSLVNASKKHYDCRVIYSSHSSVLKLYSVPVCLHTHKHACLYLCISLSVFQSLYKCIYRWNTISARPCTIFFSYQAWKHTLLVYFPSLFPFLTLLPELSGATSK